MADAIVRASFLSAKAATTGAEPSVRPTLELRFKALEYLKGSGPAEFMVTVIPRRGVSLASPYKTKADAQTAAAEALKLRNTAYDAREGVLFLSQSPSSASSASGFQFYQTMGRPEWWNDYYVDELDRAWLPKTGDSASSESNTSIIVTDPAPPGGSEMTMSLDDLRSRVAAMDALLKKGEGIDGYKECIGRMLFYGTEEREYESLTGTPWPKPTSRNSLPSGQPAGSAVYQGGLKGGDDRYNKYWLTGDDAVYFKVENKGSLIAYSTNILIARPLPRGIYNFNDYFQPSHYQPCHFIPPRYVQWTVSVTAPIDAVHEAFFDPVNVGKTVAADTTNGVLKPTTFTVSGSSATLTKIAWEGGKATMEFQPSVSLAGHHADFIGLDGKVALRLDFDDAKVTTSGAKRTFEWGACKQPWVSGDLLMLRMSKSGETLTGVTNDTLPCSKITPKPTVI